MEKTKVILIGGPPGAGKTTLGRTLAIKLGITSLTIDDLMTAMKVVTTPESHPGLHVMHPMQYIEYFTNSTAEKLIADSKLQHEEVWPSVERLIKNHSKWGSPFVIDGWTLIPQKVAGLGLENVASFWLVIDPPVLEERERANAEFFATSPDPERMFNNFFARSRWHNQFVEDQAAAAKLDILRQDGTRSVDELCETVTTRIG